MFLEAERKLILSIILISTLLGGATAILSVRGFLFLYKCACVLKWRRCVLDICSYLMSVGMDI